MENIMTKQLPPRPNLDHLRRQAKELLSSLAAGDPEAISTILNHLPAAAGLAIAEVRQRSFRLADAQSAIARKTGFASWPQLARHVEQLRALEGTWKFASLEIDGHTMPAAMMANSRILIDGDRFRTESPEATYEGVFIINVEAVPEEIDIDFVAGPEAGNKNFGIFRFDGDELHICLDLNGKQRPSHFRTSPGSGHAYERLARASTTRPENVTGGTAAPAPPASPVHSVAYFNFVPSDVLKRLQGEWEAVKVVHNGQQLPAMMLKTGVRSAVENIVKVTFGGQLMIHGLVRINDTADPIEVDYYSLCEQTKGVVQHGIMKWSGEVACFHMASAGQPRPKDFTCAAGSGGTLSHWRPKNSRT
jgi:uncharacterized protein (TIGR03067 family)